MCHLFLNFSLIMLLLEYIVNILFTDLQLSQPDGIAEILRKMVDKADFGFVMEKLKRLR